MILGQNLQDIESIKSEVIVKDYIPIHKGNYNILAGAGGVGKSQISLKILAHFLQANPNEKAVCIYTEDAKDTILTRLNDVCSCMRITVDEIVSRTFFKTLDNTDGATFISKVNRTNIINSEYMDKFILNARLENIGLVILDPLEAFHTGLNENDAEDMKNLTVDVFQRLAVSTGSAVLVLHHTSKGNNSGARGSAVITNKGRVAYNVRKVKEFDKELQIEVIKDGWENSVYLSTIKDNHFIARWCDAIANNNGKLDLPVGKHYADPTVTTFNDNDFIGDI